MRLFRRRRVVIAAEREFGSEDELTEALAGQMNTAPVRAICQLIDTHAMDELNRSLDQTQSERVCAAHAGGAAALMELKETLLVECASIKPYA